MLRVKTIVQPSSIHGIGLFAAEFIASGVIVWRFTDGIDRVFTAQQFDAMMPTERKFLSTYGWLSKHTNRYLLCVDNERFTNHSKTPNLHTKMIVGVAEGVAIAARDISAGEEITTDYDSFEDLNSSSVLLTLADDPRT